MASARREHEMAMAKVRRSERAVAVLAHLRGTEGNVRPGTLYRQMVGEETEQVEHDYEEFADIIAESRERVRKVKK